MNLIIIEYNMWDTQFLYLFQDLEASIRVIVIKDTDKSKHSLLNSEIVFQLPEKQVMYFRIYTS